MQSTLTHTGRNGNGQHGSAVLTLASMAEDLAVRVEAIEAGRAEAGKTE